jgi:hypothetical protein
MKAAESLLWEGHDLAYYGCFLNLYDSGNVIDGKPVYRPSRGGTIAWRVRTHDTMIWSDYGDA